MKKISFIFNTAPYGDSSGREALDVVLSISSLKTRVSVFFIGDGVFQLIKQQNPTGLIRIKNYTLSFKLLPLYDIDTWTCAESLSQRGLGGLANRFVIHTNIISPSIIRQKLEYSETIFRF